MRARTPREPTRIETEERRRRRRRDGGSRRARPAQGARGARETPRRDGEREKESRSEGRAPPEIHPFCVLGHDNTWREVHVRGDVGGERVVVLADGKIVVVSPPQGRPRPARLTLLDKGRATTLPVVFPKVTRRHRARAPARRLARRLRGAKARRGRRMDRGGRRDARRRDRARRQGHARTVRARRRHALRVRALRLRLDRVASRLRDHRRRHDVDEPRAARAARPDRRRSSGARAGRSAASPRAGCVSGGARRRRSPPPPAPPPHRSTVTPRAPQLTLACEPMSPLDAGAAGAEAARRRAARARPHATRDARSAVRPCSRRPASAASTDCPRSSRSRARRCATPSAACPSRCRSCSSAYPRLGDARAHLHVGTEGAATGTRRASGR